MLGAHAEVAITIVSGAHIIRRLDLFLSLGEELAFDNGELCLHHVVKERAFLEARPNNYIVVDRVAQTFY